MNASELPTLTNAINATTASHRFGLGPRPGELDVAASNPRRWLHAQVRPLAPASSLSRFSDSAQILQTLYRARRMKDKSEKRSARKALRKQFQQEIRARAEHMVRTDVPFQERMVMFWSNHFTVSTMKPVIGPSVGAYEREAIRPHVFGKFADLLVASVRHPTMLAYLDNPLSFGANSRIGNRGKRGLNENLAREVLELHTLGVNGGYSQADVRAFANVLTGWSHGAMERLAKRERKVNPAFAAMDTRNPGAGFRFFSLAHEPGSKTILGKTYREDGEGEGLAVLRDLARHPSTARFIATKLARHFVSDDPPRRAIAALEAEYRRTDGDLAALARTLIDLPDAWELAGSKVKTPYELLIASLRAVNVSLINNRHFGRALKELGHVPFAAPSPAGWPDDLDHWLGPEALMRRLAWLRAMAAQLPRKVDPIALASTALGDALTPRTRSLIENAPSTADGVTLLFASPEFQRR